MSQKFSSEVNWSEEEWRDYLIGSRRFLWAPDTVAKIAAWVPMRPGMTVVDVGCGNGYLGLLYWKHFGQGGNYTGVDASGALIEDAKKMAPNWAYGGKASFVVGDAYHLEFPNESADLVMCQTLLIHLKDPTAALREMSRVLKPGGLILCKEPDNASNTVIRSFSTVSQPSIEDWLFASKMELLRNKGRIRLGRGDDSIGNQVPLLLYSLGFSEIDCRINDTVEVLLPPYDTPKQKSDLASYADNPTEWDHPNAYFSEMMIREEVLAGGGTVEEAERYHRMVRKRKAHDDSARAEQIRTNRFAACGAGLFYATKARKPR